MSILPYAKQTITSDDIEAVVEVLRGDYLTTGPTVEQLERQFREATNAEFAIACSSGTAALHLAAIAADLQEGDVAIVPSVTFLATANAIRLTGAEVRFADVDPETGLMTTETFLDALNRDETGKVKALLPVHLSGQCCPMARLSELARTNDIKIIEDACHALGGQVGNTSVGDCCHSDMAIFSLHPAKIVAGGEGGVVTTNDEPLARSMMMTRNHGMSRNPEDFSNALLAFDSDQTANSWYYEMTDVGLNYRLSDLHAALALSQMKRLSEFVDMRRCLVSAYDARIASLAPVVRPTGRISGQLPGWHLYSTLWDFEAIGISRNQVMAQLRDKGVGTQVHYIPLHLQPYYQSRYGKTELPGAEQYYHSELSLPLHAAMNEADADRVVSTIESIIRA